MKPKKLMTKRFPLQPRRASVGSERETVATPLFGRQDHGTPRRLSSFDCFTTPDCVEAGAILPFGHALPTDIGGRNLLGSSLLDDASVSGGEGQPDLPSVMRQKTSALHERVAVFFLFSFSYDARAVSIFLGGTFFVSSSLVLSFNSFPSEL